MSPLCSLGAAGLRVKPAMTKASSHRARGAALLTAMITVALVATLAAAALWRQWRGVEVESAERSRVQSSWILNGALDWGRLVLAGDARESSVDHLGEPWAVPLEEARLSTFLAGGQASTDTEREAFLSGRVTDLQSRLNVMNLLLEPAPANEEDDSLAAKRPIERFRKLFTLLGLPEQELESLQRNLANAATAMQSTNPGETGDAPLLPQRFDQLLWLGLTPPTLEALRPYATLLPLVNKTVTRVNLNTASAQTIYAAVPELDLAGAERLVSERERAYFRSASTALQSVQRNDSAPPTSDWVGVTSDFFEIRGRLRLDDLALQETSVVQRATAGQRRTVQVLWRQRMALSTEE